MSRKKRISKRKLRRMNKKLHNLQLANKKVKYWKYRQKLAKKYHIRDRK